ncbi:MAG: DsrE/DsrF/DrsH-like family protein [Deltaproteobacteria bacterium]|nr:DsrE/DsrF/DrsH-like family protein [Deltaproteobacteria bacterium]
MDTVKVDCRGMQCPAPILEIAKAARSVANQPAVLEIIADDDDFPNDVEAWCRTTRAELKTMRRDEQGHRAVIALNGAQFEGQGIVSRATVELPVAVLKQRPRHISEVMSANRSAPARRPEALGAAPAAPVAPPPVAAAPSVPEVMILPPDPIDAPLQVDLVGQRAPQPVLRLSQVLVSNPGRLVHARCDDPSFMTDVVVWANSIHAKVEGLEQTPAGLIARLVLPGEASTSTSVEVRPLVSAPAALAAPTVGPAPEPQVSNRCTLLVMRNDFESLMAAMLTANAARAQQMDVVVCFSFWGVNVLRGDRKREDVDAEPVSFLQRIMKWLMPRGPKRQKMSKMHMGGFGLSLMEHFMKRNQVLTLTELIESAVESEVRFMVCTMSMGIMGIQKRDLMDLPNLEFGGVTCFVEQARDSRMALVF